MRIMEVPIAVRYFPDRKSRVVRGIWQYALNTATIIFRGYRDYFPLRFFVGLSLLFAIPGTVLGLVFIGHFLLTGRFSPYLFAGFGSGFCFVMATLFLILGVVADMLDRIRANQERVLYLLKRNGQSRYRSFDQD
jgi:hypothetical protein